MIKSIITILILGLSAFAHGIYYDVIEGAIAVRITAPNNVPISNAKVEVYAPDASLAFVQGKSDINGNFAFLPDSKGNWRILINADSDHGGHLKEFTINIDDKFQIKDFEKPPYERYFTIISVLGFLFGVFGVFSMIKSRRDTTK